MMGELIVRNLLPICSWLHPHPVPLLRISAQLYNDLDQFKRLASLLEEALRGG